MRKIQQILLGITCCFSNGFNLIDCIVLTIY